MSRLIRIALLTALCTCTATGPEGPQGPPGPQGPEGPGFMGMASVSSVVPAAVTQGSEYDLTVSGFATDWTDAATVSFGQGVTVTRVKAASATSLLVHVKVAPDALPDVRDVSVTHAGATLFWRNAFSVLERVKFSTLGTASQLSLSVVRLQVNEPQFEFETSTTNGRFDGVAISSSPALPLQLLGVSSKVVDMLVLADLDAGIGAYDISVVSRPGSFAERKFSAQQLVTVTPRQSTELLDGVPANGSIDKSFQSATYRWEPTTGLDAGMITTYLLNVASSAPELSPKIALMPASGQWADSLGFNATMAVTPAPGSVYWLVLFEASGASGFGYTLTATPVRRIAEEEPNEPAAGARPLMVPGLVGPCQLSSLLDADWVRVTATAADVGKRFHVVTQPGDSLTDTKVQLFQGDGTTPFGNASDDLLEHEDHFSPPITAAGDYFVKVWMSPTVVTFDAMQSHYDLLVDVE